MFVELTEDKEKQPFPVTKLINNVVLSGRDKEERWSETPYGGDVDKGPTGGKK